LGTRAENSASSPARLSGSSDGKVSSAGEDTLTGSQYLILRGFAEGGNDLQRWQVEYRANNGHLLAETNLPDTSRVMWRRASEAGDPLATGGHVALCADQVWVLQDGYRLLTNRFDKTLTAVNQGETEITRPSEVSLISDVGCSAGGGLTISGFVFGVSDTEPQLSADPVQAHRFEIELDRLGRPLRKYATRAEFFLPAFCASRRNERIQFCTEAKRAVGW